MPTDLLDAETDAPETSAPPGGEKTEKNAKGENLDPGQRKRIGHDQQGKSKIGKAISNVTNPAKRARDMAQNLNPMNRLRKMQENLSPSQLLKKGIKNLAKGAIELAKRNPYVIAAILIVIFIIAIILIIMGASSAAADPNAPQLTITKTGPSQAAIGDLLPYQIVVSYPSTAQDIIVTDHIPTGTKYLDSTPPAKWDEATQTATWNLKDYIVPPATILSNASSTLSIRLQATANDSSFYNQATATVTGAGAKEPGGPVSGEYLAPNSTNCSGKYSLTTAIGNFGDPSCNFDQNTLYDMLVAQDAANADIWFFRIVPCESGYDPNAYAPPSTGTPDAGGAWGLFQMGSSTPPGQPPPAPGKNDVTDRGDVNWPVQASNATSYAKLIGGDLQAYWEGARGPKTCWLK